ncbi:MAG: AAA family ATPase [Deltaproteobacteria bacterium]|nr:AAA family ATPase [Deltaproteobacteria bacterium]
MSKTRLTVSVGGGGVGKTTTSAALALAMARSHKRTLVITVDPARRLADALGAQVGQQAVPVSFGPDSDGWLYARMPDPRASLDDFATWLFEDPVRRKHLMDNPAYRELGDSLAGVHELVTIGLLQHEVDSGKYDEVVLDTAPSRHALAFLTYPGRLLGLLEARSLAWLAALAHVADVSNLEEHPRTGLLEWGRSKVEALVGKVVGLEGLRNLSALFGDMVAVRERWAGLARRTNTMLRDPTTRYFIIGAPTGGAMADVSYLANNLSRHGLNPSAIVLNRAEQDAPESEQVLRRTLDNGGADRIDATMRDALRTMLQTLGAEHTERSEAARKACERLQAIAPAGTSIVRLPFVHRNEPRAIVVALADAWKAAGID